MRAVVMFQTSISCLLVPPISDLILAANTYCMYPYLRILNAGLLLLMGYVSTTVNGKDGRLRKAKKRYDVTPFPHHFDLLYRRIYIRTEHPVYIFFLHHSPAHLTSALWAYMHFLPPFLLLHLSSLHPVFFSILREMAACRSIVDH